MNDDGLKWLPPIGMRVRFRRQVDRYPDFCVPAGAMGVVIEANPDMIGVALDEFIEGAMPWGNVLYFYDATTFDRSRPRDEWQDFAGEIEILGGCPQTWANCGVPTVARGKREILQDIADGTVPATVTDFAQLHDYVDANYYGGAFESWTEGRPAEDEWVGFWNRVQEELHCWLKAGRPTGDFDAFTVAVYGDGPS